MMGIWQGFKTLSTRALTSGALATTSANRARLVGLLAISPAVLCPSVLCPAVLASDSGGGASGLTEYPVRLPSAHQPAVSEPSISHQDQGDELERLRGMLDKSGPDGKTERESAIAQLMAMARPEAHRLLHDRLRRREDPDQLRASILDALRKHLLGNPSAQFGGANEDVRKSVVTGYLGACAPLWEGANEIDDPASAPVRAAARQALQRVPARELDVAARALMTVTTIDPGERVLVLRCLADMQQTLLARTIADNLEAPDQIVREGAVRSLQLLTYADRPIRTKAEFEAWYAEHGSVPYVNLVERSARSGSSTYDSLRAELEQLRVHAAREFVTVHVAAKPGVNWPAVQERTLSGGPSVLDACLQALQSVLGDSAGVQGTAPARQAFFRALVDRFRKIRKSPQVEVQRRSALLLEVAAYLVRPEESEAANEIRGLLLQQLDASAVTSRIAALRGLRRFPSPEARKALVARARQMLASKVLIRSAANKQLLQVMLETLLSRTEPRWMAPSAKDEDKADWLKLIDESCHTSSELGLREQALLLAQTLDGDGHRVPEAFDILLALANAEQLETKFRATCLIYLEAWRSDTKLARRWLNALHTLLEDREVGMRRQAAESMVLLPESSDNDRAVWYADSLAILRARLILEPDQSVLRPLVDCIKVIGRQPEMPEKAIGALKFVLGQLGTPPAPEHVFRLEPLLQALAAIAADPEARGQWLAACEPLLANQKRDGLRLVLVSHGAADLAKLVDKTGSPASTRASQAMRYLIQAAALREGREPWSTSEALMGEARDVRAAFEALDKVDVSQRLDTPAHRLVRLAVELAVGRHQDVVLRATAWLGNGAATPGVATGPGPAQPSQAAYFDHMRLLAAQAQFALAKPLPALALLEARSAEARNDPAALQLATKIAQALLPTVPKRAADLFESTLKATSTEDPAFRARLVDWMRARIQLDPSSRAATLAEGARHAGLFAASDCPPKLREAYEQLRSPN